MEYHDTQEMHVKEHISQSVEEMMKEDLSGCVCMTVYVCAPVYLSFEVESRIYT